MLAGRWFAAMASAMAGLSPASRASRRCAWNSYCAVHLRPAMMIAISFSRCGIEVPNRTKAPRRWTRSQSSGLRRSALNGPRRPAPRGPDWIASATRFWSAVIVSGVSVVNLGSLIAFLPDSFGTARVPPPGHAYFVDAGLERSRAACCERPHVAIPRETDHFHLAGGSRARPVGDAPRAGVLRKNGRDRVRQPQNVARVVATATRRFGRETLAPDGGIERIAELTLECQRDVSGRLFAPEPSSANPVLGCRGFDNEVHHAAAPDERSVFLAQDREIAERELLIARERVLQPCGRLFGRARPASGIKMLRDFGERVDASEERQIIRRDPAQHEASRLQPVCAVRQGHREDAFMSLAL